MNIRRQRALFRLADSIIVLVSVFLLLDAMLGFTGPRRLHARPVSQNTNSTNLSTSCIGGFSNERTVNGVTQVASHGTPFNAYQLTLTNIGDSVITIYNVTVELTGSVHHVFTRQQASLGNGTGITLNLGQSRQVVESAGISHPVTSCEVLGWQS